eukprot:gene2671-2076_t
MNTVWVPTAEQKAALRHGCMNQAGDHQLQSESAPSDKGTPATRSCWDKFKAFQEAHPEISSMEISEVVSAGILTPDTGLDWRNLLTKRLSESTWAYGLMLLAVQFWMLSFAEWLQRGSDMYKPM